jgi:2-amino-4-hydroxy-6-hydroxymethyldihydropteridine diphosphokinase
VVKPKEFEHIAYVALGSNLGDRQMFIAYGIRRLSRLSESSLRSISGLYATKPVGIERSMPFLNMVVELHTDFDVHTLLRELQEIERDAGRTKDQKKKSRVLDLDILLFDADILESADVSVPHPEMHKRRFMLQPLADIAADLVHPLLGKPIQEILLECDDQHWVKKL